MRSYCVKWLLGLWLLSYFHNSNIDCKNSPQTPTESQVEVRAVFINCEASGRQDNTDSSSQRFERQELFKHNALRSCNKKLALTVKIASGDPAHGEHAQEGTDGDEYIPIDHVFDGSDRKRVRLLNPYILRLRRELPKQAYKLHRIDTVSGILTNTYLARQIDTNIDDRQMIRERRDLNSHELGEDTGFEKARVFKTPTKQSYSDKIDRLQERIQALRPNTHEEISQNRGKRDVCPITNCLLREKRQHEVTMIVTPKHSGGRHHYQLESDRAEQNIYVNERRSREEEKSLSIDESEAEVITEDVDEILTSARNTRSVSVDKAPKRKTKDKSRQKELHTRTRSTPKYKDDDNEKITEDTLSDRIMIGTETAFAVYEIGEPSLWNDVKVHLFEKLSTPEGKTVWNDLTKGEDASVSSTNPEWKGQDVNVRYRPAEWVPRDDFTLPATKLCLLEPLRDNVTALEDDPYVSNSQIQKFIVVPVEDVVYLESKINLKHRVDNVTTSSDINEYEIQAPRRVEVRVSRAIMGSKTNSYDIAHFGQDCFLTMPHTRPHRSQLDVEVRADENVLVRVGSSGRLATIVTDNTRKKRTIVHFQATNTGLASARFKAVIRECGPELSTLMKQSGSEEIASEPILLPPHHTRRLKLEVPLEIPTDATHCNVALVNDEDESVAVRDVSIRKGDRCFCVWHCECVCLNEDPKLLCREMSQTQQVAAGLTPSAERPRHTRSVCFADNIAVDFVTVFLAVILILLQLGLLKAILGLFSVRIKQLGWDSILDSRRIDRYYELCLRNRKVVYQDGWPVHPDTKKRTVQILSCPASFLVNIVFFIVVPCIAMYSLLKRALGTISGWIYSNCKCKSWKTDEQIFNAHDVQSSSMELLLRKKRQRRGITDWMSPCAEQLTADVINGAMDPTSSSCCGNTEMQPLLNDKQPRSRECAACALPPSPYSDQDDTEYVLMQMQKSRESLARSQKKFDESLHCVDPSVSQTKCDLTAPPEKKN